LGFGNEPPTHLVYAWVDSLDGVAESDETNNISTPAVITNVTPAATPTPSSTPSSGGSISGVIYYFEDGFTTLWRATVYLFDDATGSVIAVTESDETGHYEFVGLPVPSTTYQVHSCREIDGQEYFGYRNALLPPQDLVYISLFARPCPYG
jgi:hypothetical protein